MYLGAYVPLFQDEIRKCQSQNPDKQMQEDFCGNFFVRFLHDKKSDKI